MEQKLDFYTVAKYPNARLKNEYGVIDYHYVLRSGDIFGKLNGRDVVEQLKNCRLILTPLEKISDENAVELSDLMFDYYSDYGEEWKIGTISVMLSNQRFEHPYATQDSVKAMKMQDYLRSKNYDCDNLIQTGIATTNS